MTTVREKWEEDIALALAMGVHPRLGQESSFLGVATQADLLRLIVSFAFTTVPVRVLVRKTDDFPDGNVVHQSTMKRDDPRIPGGPQSLHLTVSHGGADASSSACRIDLPFASAVHVSGYLKMDELLPNGGYFNLELGTDQPAESGYLEVKFDNTCLRAYGNVTPNDIRVRADIQAKTWIKLDIRLRPKERRVDFDVNGRQLSSIVMIGLQWSCIRAISLKGWARSRRSCQWDSLVVEELADPSEARAPVPMVLVLEEEATSSDNRAHAHTRASHFWEWGSLHEHAP